MSLDLAEYYGNEADSPREKKDTSTNAWLSENVWAPMVNGSGVIQQYNNFTTNDVALLKQAEAPLGSANWAVQTLSGVAGAIVPYVIAGKLTNKALGSIAEQSGMRGMSARIMTNSSVANVVGAGLYDFAKEPLQGETRLGTALGTMAGFSVFEAGNHILGQRTRFIASTNHRLLAQTAGRFAVGAGGGALTFETSQAMDGMLGARDDRSWHGRLEHAVSGGFLNVAMPVLHKGVERAVDAGYNSRSFGPGVPVGRFLQYRGITDLNVIEQARWNPTARVKIASDGVTKADVQRNTVFVPEKSTPGQLGHELGHLRIARQLEPHFQDVARTAAIDPVRAQNKFMNMRAYAEFQARLLNALVDSNVTPETMARTIENAGNIGSERAANGRTYAENWRTEWQHMQGDPNFRPRFEYSPESAAPREPAKPAEADARPQPEASATKSLADAADPRLIRVTDTAALGTPEPLGATVTDTGINFAVHSRGATKVELLLFTPDAKPSDPVQTLPMNRTGDVWHRFVEGPGAGTEYLYRAFGSYNPAVDGTRFNGNMALLDPYSKAVTGDTNRPVAYDNSNPKDPDRHLRPGTKDAVEDMSRSVAWRDNFDWQGDRPPNTPMVDSIIYELNVRGFTAGDTSLGPLAGTYRGLVEKLPYLEKLGVTAIELLPIQQFEKVDSFNGQMAENPKNPETGEPLRNQWGYQTSAYQAPEASYAADGRRGQQVTEFKYLVREAHKRNIEVILDIVFNHTAEDGHLGPTISFRGLDNNVYYMLAPNAPDKYVDHTGCRNTLNVNDPVVQKLILDTLRYWVKEMHVDGFRFDLATVFNYDKDGVDRHRTPIIKAIENDPDLRHVKLIAEPWSIDQYKVGNFAPRRWAEWNGVFRDTIRRFLKSDGGMLADLSERITGSRKWFEARKGRHSVNFVTAHDGFRLNDLVSYNEKHNMANGENNRDGANDNYSWNHGVEGPVEAANIPESHKIAIEQLRNRQVKNAMALLLLSQGTPMLLSGDEFRQTANGNNNYWPQEKLNNLDWTLVDKHPDVLRFVSMMIALRKEFAIGRHAPSDVLWHGTRPHDQHFQPDGRFIAWELLPQHGQTRFLYSAFNAYWEPLEVTLPPLKWRRRVDTSLPQGQDIVGPGEGTVIEGGKYIIQPRSGIVFESVEPNPATANLSEPKPQQ